ncbi:hypothetical protein [Kribbella italica]|uniref:DUF8094 domain-containing protein n=1 Tax=Kribbella italica TaxID=1540520 RepID=A0A7W9JB67_9ACTN|nr:hypothetical protein [Kribbella italica]MBB5838957.1 hypothetical protein [Kribbella italica]
MRFARITLGLPLALVGVVATLAGAASAFWLVGPDSTVETGEQRLTSRGLAVATAPDLLARHGFTLHVTASSARPVFVGVAHDLDVSSYLGEASYTRIVRFDLPSDIATQEMKGGSERLNPPTGLDWWVADAGGAGKQSAEWETLDGAYDVVVMNADGTPGVDATVTFGAELKGLFGICLVVLGAGLILLFLGIWLVMPRRRRPEEPSAPVTRQETMPYVVPTVPSRPTAAAHPPVPAQDPAPVRPPVPAPVRPAVPAQDPVPVRSPFPAQDPAPAPVRPSAPAPAPTPAPTSGPAPASTPAPSSAGSAPISMGSGPASSGSGPASSGSGPASSGSGAASSGSTPASAGSAPTPAGSAPTSAGSSRPGTGTGASAPRPEPADEPAPRPAPVPGIPPQYQAPAYSPPKAKRVVSALTGGMLLLTATGCVAVPQENTSSGPFTRAAVTVAGGLAVVEKYNDLNNQANQARNPKLAEAIETDPTLAMTRAGYQIGRKTDETGKDKVKPFTYTEPVVGAPQYGAYPMRFVVASGVSTSPDNKQLGVWERTTAGDPWVLKYSVYPSTTVKLPPLEGLRAPTKTDMSKLASLPQSAAANLAEYLTGGPNSPKASLFTPSPGTVTLLNQRAKDKVTDAKKPYIATATDTFRPSGDPLTFITADGRALVFLALTEQYLQRVEPGSNAYWTSGPPTAFSSYVKYTQTLHQDYLHQLAVVIPPKGQGKLQILSLDGQLVGAGGS